MIEFTFTDWIFSIAVVFCEGIAVIVNAFVIATSGNRVRTMQPTSFLTFWICAVYLMIALNSFTTVGINLAYNGIVDDDFLVKLHAAINVFASMALLLLVLGISVIRFLIVIQRVKVSYATPPLFLCSVFAISLLVTSLPFIDSVHNRYILRPSRVYCGPVWTMNAFTISCVVLVFCSTAFIVFAYAQIVIKVRRVFGEELGGAGESERDVSKVLSNDLKEPNKLRKTESGTNLSWGIATPPESPKAVRAVSSAVREPGITHSKSDGKSLRNTLSAKDAPLEIPIHPQLRQLKVTQRPLSSDVALASVAVQPMHPQVRNVKVLSRPRSSTDLRGLPSRLPLASRPISNGKEDDVKPPPPTLEKVRPASLLRKDGGQYTLIRISTLEDVRPSKIENASIARTTVVSMQDLREAHTAAATPVADTKRAFKQATIDDDGGDPSPKIPPKSKFLGKLKWTAVAGQESGLTEEQKFQKMMLKQSVVIVFSFLIAWVPYFLLIMMELVTGTQVSPAFDFVAVISLGVNGIVSPILALNSDRGLKANAIQFFPLYRKTNRGNS